MSELAKQLGKRIYLFRKQSKLTQAALAEKAKISNEFMSGMERGIKLPSMPTLERLAAVLRIQPKDLLNFDQTNFRRIQVPSRECMDVALELENLPPLNRKQILKIVRILTKSLHQ